MFLSSSREYGGPVKLTGPRSQSLVWYLLSQGSPRFRHRHKVVRGLVEETGDDMWPQELCMTEDKGIRVVTQGDGTE